MPVILVGKHIFPACVVEDITVFTCAVFYRVVLGVKLGLHGKFFAGQSVPTGDFATFRR